ncbi:MAG: hypothetical protein V3R13_03935 [Nitrososphaerales archaeon]
MSRRIRLPYVYKRTGFSKASPYADRRKGSVYLSTLEEWGHPALQRLARKGEVVSEKEIIAITGTIDLFEYQNNCCKGV